MPASRVTSQHPWHIVLVIDDSGSMSGTPSNDVNEALKELIANFEMISMGQKPYFKLSVISFGSQAKTISEAVSETAVDENMVASFSGGSGSTNAAEAFEEAIRVLQRNPGKESDFEPFVFFFSDGAPDDEGAALKAADKLKAVEVAAGKPRIVALGFGHAVASFMQQVASNPELYKALSSSSEILKFLPNIGTVAQSQAEGGAEAVAEGIMKL